MMRVEMTDGDAKGLNHFHLGPPLRQYGFHHCETHGRGQNLVGKIALRVENPGKGRVGPQGRKLGEVQMHPERAARKAAACRGGLLQGGAVGQQGGGGDQACGHQVKNGRVGLGADAQVIGVDDQSHREIPTRIRFLRRFGRGRTAAAASGRQTRGGPGKNAFDNSLPLDSNSTVDEK